MKFQRRKRTRRNIQEQRLYLELSEAMDCLEHICTEGCTSVGPYGVEPRKNKGPCSMFATCKGVQLLIKHFATCKKRVNGGCLRCKRMWQLLRLHSSICEHPDSCGVPLCRYFSSQPKCHYFILSIVIPSFLEKYHLDYHIGHNRFNRNHQIIMYYKQIIL